MAVNLEDAIGVGLGAAVVGGLAACGLAVGGLAYAAMAPGSRVFGGSLEAPKRPDEIALTFDDGPNPSCTPQLLELLARHGVRASFFLIGRYARAERGLARQIHEGGHLIGNHTWTHPNLAVTSERRTREELVRTSDEIAQVIGAPVGFFRPPFGGRRPATLRIARELGMTPVLWNVIGNDWNAASSEAITGRVMRLMGRNLRRGVATNLVLHDGGHLSSRANRSKTLAAVGELLERFERSRRFVGLDEWG